MMENDQLNETAVSPKIDPKSVKKNFGYQSIYQIITLILPLVTAPFLTRRLGDTALGIYSYILSCAFYFLVFAMLGVDNYGSRTIAENRGNDLQLRKNFWGIFVDHSVASIFAALAYLLFCFFAQENKSLYFINIIYVLSALFDITWLFKGLENFQKVTTANLVVKVLCTVLIFVFIKTPADIGLYTWIMCGSVILGNLALFPWVFTHIKPISLSWLDCVKHIKPLLILFAAYAAFSLYTMFDKTLLGLMSTKEEVAYYTYASKINDIPRTIMNVITIVLLPRMSALVAQKNTVKIQRNINISLEFVTILGMGAMFGFLSIGPELACVYLGESFSESGTMLLWMSPLSFIYVLGSIARDEYLIPMGKDKGYTISMIIAAVVNLSLSAVLIFYIGPVGAIIGTVVAESIATGIEVFLAKDVLHFKSIFLKLIPYCLCGGAMYGVLFGLNYFWSGYSVVHLIVEIVIGLFVYLILSCIYLFALSPQKKSANAFLKEYIHFKR